MNSMDIDLVMGVLVFRAGDSGRNECHRTGRARRVDLPAGWTAADVAALSSLCKGQLERVRAGYYPKLVSLKESRGELTDDGKAALAEIMDAMAAAH